MRDSTFRSHSLLGDSEAFAGRSMTVLPLAYHEYYWSTLWLMASRT